MNDIVTFSAVQPTGCLHLGNYLGAIMGWVDMQNLSKLNDSHKNYFCVADLHAITVPQDPKELRKSTLDTVAMYIACGIDPNKSTIFVQSTSIYHTELLWILSSITPMGWLNVMTQYKDKKEQNNNLGLYSYPVLMAADILLYKTNYVPVGNDQIQHLQLARDIAGAFNRHYKIDFFKIPEAIIDDKSARIMSLRDGTKKMSKSDVSDYSRINMLDEPDLIRLKIKKAICDDAGRKNLFDIWKALGGYTDVPFGNEDFKKLVAEKIIEHLEPIQKKYHEIREDEETILAILRDGILSANTDETIQEVRNIVGFIDLWDGFNG